MAYDFNKSYNKWASKRKSNNTVKDYIKFKEKRASQAREGYHRRKAEKQARIEQAYTKANKTYRREVTLNADERKEAKRLQGGLVKSLTSMIQQAVFEYDDWSVAKNLEGIKNKVKNWSSKQMLDFFNLHSHDIGFIQYLWGSDLQDSTLQFDLQDVVKAFEIF